MVSEVNFPRFWRVVCVEKCFRNFEIVIGSAVSEMLRFARFYVKCAYDYLLFIDETKLKQEFKTLRDMITLCILNSVA